MGAEQLMQGGDVVNFAIFMLIILPILIIWSFIWKAWALWVSARNGSKPWFAVIFIVNTLGILEILYIFIFSKQSKGNNDLQEDRAKNLNENL